MKSLILIAVFTLFYGLFFVQTMLTLSTTKSSVHAILVSGGQ